MMWKTVFAIAIGAAGGALLRWQLGERLNALFPTVPPGTLTANLVGAYVVGVCVAFFAQWPALSPEWRLLLITGYLGALTTFSTFSLETVSAGRAGLTLQALTNILINNLGGLSLTWLGLRLGGLR